MPRRLGSAPALVRGGLAILLVVYAAACAWSSTSPLRYRLTDSGTHWDVAGRDRVLDDLRPRYPEYFEALLDPSVGHDLDLRPLRDDLERRPVDRRNYDALNAIAIGYFELNYRAETRRGEQDYLRQSFRVAHMLAMPWRAYSEIEDPALRDAILDFFEDAASGVKLGAAATSSRLMAIVASLEAKESNPERRERIRAIVREIEVRHPEAAQADGPAR